MDRSRRVINPRHEPVRKVLRVAGPITLIAGVCCFFGSVVLVMMTQAMGFGLLAFLGIPLMFAGTVMCMFGFMGAVARYQAQEVAPVASDTFNYLAEETQPGVRTMAAAVRDGFTEAPAVACNACGAANDDNARFCDACGAPLAGPATCASCGQENDVEARFCDGCGQPLR